MALIFRIERTKKAPRITVLREKKSGAKRELPELLGSFNEKKSFDHITDQLTESELYEFNNFVGTLEFGKHYFQCQADELDRFIFKAPTQLKGSLYKIWKEAKQYGIEFLPDKEMLLAVLNRGKQIEQQLKELSNGKFSALSDLGIKLGEPFLQPTHSIHESRKIMAALFSTNLSYDELANKFNEVATSFNKQPKFTSRYFENIHEKLLIEGQETFPKWHYSIAIEVLKELDITLEQVASPAIITKHWLHLNKQKNYEMTLMDFNTALVEFSENTVCHNIIKKSFMDDELTNMGRLPQHKTPNATIAIEKWLNHLKKTKKNLTLDNVLVELKKQYPLLNENAYIQELVRNRFK